MRVTPGRVPVTSFLWLLLSAWLRRQAACLLCVTLMQSAQAGDVFHLRSMSCFGSVLPSSSMLTYLDKE